MTRRSIAIVVIALASLVPVGFHAQESEAAALQQIYVEANAAYRDKAYPRYLAKMQELAARRPAHPTILYKLAGAYALNRRPTDAAHVLERIAGLQLTYDVRSDPDFEAVSMDAVIQSAARRMDEVRERRIGTSEVAWTIPDPTFIPEGITYDPASKSFFVSSQYQQRIVRIDEKGTVTPFVSDGQDGLWMAFGMGVDAKRRLLWVVSTAEPSMKGFTAADEKRAGLFAFHIDTGALARKIIVEVSTPAHYFDDLVVRSDGRVFLSDGGHRAIYTVAPDANALELLVAPGTIQAPNGLALGADERTLFVSDYAGFICRVDLETRAVTRLAQPSDTTLYGIDGLVYHRGALVGIQNGVAPSRIVRLALSSDGRSIASVSILEMNHPAFAEPTLGTVVDDTYYYIANSHGRALRTSNGHLDALRLTVPTVLKLRLD